MILSYEGLKDTAAWKKAGVGLPAFDWKAMSEKTLRSPAWVHFGTGNIFRGFIASLQQSLLNQGLTETGILAVESFDLEIPDVICTPHDCMTLNVTLHANGETDREVLASLAACLHGDQEHPDWETLKQAFRSPSLQMATMTITEKGYALKDLKGEWTPFAAHDRDAGPQQARTVPGILSGMLYERFQAGQLPMALVSLDNCARNGEKLRDAVLTLCRVWEEKGFVPHAFVLYVEDENRVSFPWTMIDKITPRPDDTILEMLTRDGIEDMAPVITGKRTYIAPFVNAEAPQYLVMEDRFPNGRPPLEKAGVLMTDREHVHLSERMKVTTCLNPLHTALAVYGCLLGYTRIWEEMKDPDLVNMIRKIGYEEGLPVVRHPGILEPRAFLDEVIQERLPNPFMPDAPQRIATDTSQKVPIRFGETLKSYVAAPDRDPASLTALPLALAGWLRYLMGIDDEGNPMELSPDPMLPVLKQQMNSIVFGKPETIGSCLQPLLENADLFGISLKEAGIAEKVQRLFAEMIAGKGAVRKTLHTVLA